MERNLSRVATRVGEGGTIVDHLPAGPGGEPSVIIELDDGRRIEAPVTALQRTAEDHYLLVMEEAREYLGREAEIEEDASEVRVVPVIEEDLEVQKRIVETGRVRVHKRVQERVETLDEPLLQERVEVERVPIERFVDEMPAVRHEGDTMIIPVVEEVLVLEKRLLLKEEVRLTKQQSESRDTREVTLRREEVVVERVPGEDEPQAGVAP